MIDSLIIEIDGYRCTINQQQGIIFRCDTQTADRFLQFFGHTARKSFNIEDIMYSILIVVIRCAEQAGYYVNKIWVTQLLIRNVVQG